MRNTGKFYAFPHVDIQEPSDVQFWCNEYNCTEEQLKAAVMVVGVHPIDVGIALGRQPDNHGVFSAA